MGSTTIRRAALAASVVKTIRDAAQNADLPAVSGETIRRAARDLGVAALLGGNLFGRLAMHPALASISDQSERGAVVNRAWRRYGTVNSLSLIAVVASSASDPSRTRLMEAAIAAVTVTGLASAVEGVRFAGSAPGGAVPLASGSAPAPETPARAARLKRVLGVLGALNLASDVALLVIDATPGRDHGGRRRVRRR
jgi:hypothetical protein